ncbi:MULTISPECIES: hypothetical protein [Vibrio]|uniref:hypothetical protein n=1 Tax=Vibrio TaxID=662 RepID=UPI001558B3AC|nr:MULTISPECIES: hypothetical protein [Vibrio]EHJ9959031.1 hypothetical protein [Vibrio parahaemolyticus]ELK9266512.1 hypothetical protein [Vibrio alginolyticus]ELN6906260.1 hypothetical protein [Vibrio alginolyticus]EME3977722.1 hypothetical protein [Vibrio alginolyticus]MCR9392378.1 hypothetical protein [Vibrio alginolyticus]
MKAFFIRILLGISDRVEWALNHKEHYVSWRKAGIFILTLATLSFMQISLVILPVEKDGKYNLFETERIEKIQIENILEFDCKTLTNAYTQCSMAKYQLRYVQTLLPIFQRTTEISLTLGTILLMLSVFGGWEAKSVEFREWKKINDSNSTDSTNSNETHESENETSRQISSDS